jgi:hypothetical protein
VSADGLTVAAFAVHIADAELAAASSSGAFFATRAITLASSPEKPSSRNRRIDGRSCGGSTPWLKPRSASCFILRRPCFAAAFGFATDFSLVCDATLPNDNPA